MLVLTRKQDEVIIIGEDIRITIVEIRGEQVKVGIDAPRHIPVHRQEVYTEIKKEVGRQQRGTGPSPMDQQKTRRPPI